MPHTKNVEVYILIRQMEIWIPFLRQLRPFQKSFKAKWSSNFEYISDNTECETNNFHLSPCETSLFSLKDKMSTHFQSKPDYAWTYQQYQLTQRTSLLLAHNHGAIARPVGSPGNTLAVGSHLITARLSHMFLRQVSSSLSPLWQLPFVPGNERTFHMGKPHTQQGAWL